MHLKMEMKLKCKFCGKELIRASFGKIICSDFNCRKKGKAKKKMSLQLMVENYNNSFK